ncbi:hypothetical protein CEXT_417101 [Caerostris extrusa]|uniref:RNase H type-1 domain-containing protein n=1 Tax=Caerostris extrusa TaxID=172846 RepID=A0AAV4U397_CAEEX|nr:hypothetical protein CEXT_417101 [Caerostris extrusa]
MLHFYQLKYLHKSITVQNTIISAAELEDPPTIEPPWEKKYEWKYHQESDSGCCIFTDGSKMGNRVGCAMKLYFLKNKIQDFTTQDLVIRAQSFPFFISFIPPWDKKSITWNVFNENITGTLIFTDGSRMDNKVGGAFVVCKNNIETSHKIFRLSDHPTLFTAELMAVNAAVDYCITNHLQASSIITDSISVLLALVNVNNTNSEISIIKN